jgi:predicted Rossmann-fold nucleotide-binding protein
MHEKLVIFYNIDGFYDSLFTFLDSLNARGVVNKPWDKVYARANTLEELEQIIN